MTMKDLSIHSQSFSISSIPSEHRVSRFPIPLSPILPQSYFRSSPPLSATLKSPKGFGAETITDKKKISTKKKKTRKKMFNFDESDEEGEEDESEGIEDTVPQIVTDRMMKRMGLSVGVPFALGMGFFPVFYYLKKSLKIDVPTWIPFTASFLFFGSALLGVSYGIVSSSWDPLREGSFLGWTEARKNWPVFWRSLFGK